MSTHDLWQNIIFAAILLYLGYQLNKIANKVTNDELQDKNNQRLIEQMRREFEIYRKG